MMPVAAVSQTSDQSLAASQSTSSADPGGNATAQAMEALSSATGVALRLIASIPPLGVSLDAQV